MASDVHRPHKNNSTRPVRRSSRQDKPCRDVDAFPCCPPPPPPPSPVRPVRRNNKNSGGNCVAPARSDRRIGAPGSRLPLVEKVPARKLVMEEVTILKRGDVLKDRPAADDHRRPCREGEVVGYDDLALGSTEWLGPDPEILPKQTRLVDRKPHPYAGWGFVNSPSPSSLPFPTSFFSKKDAASKMDLAPKGLRYLLRLDLP